MRKLSRRDADRNNSLNQLRTLAFQIPVVRHAEYTNSAVSLPPIDKGTSILVVLDGHTYGENKIKISLYLLLVTQYPLNLKSEEN